MLELGSEIYVRGEVAGIEKDRDGNIVYKIDVANKGILNRPERVIIPEHDMERLTKTK